jgi:hypothetical protein
VAGALDDLLAGFEPVSLRELDERAALLRRVDHKYVLERDELASLAERLRQSHEVLEIDGRRRFAYESVYFDTPDLRCYHDHVEDRTPRFKARTRWYRDAGECKFEAKLKAANGETDKRQIDHAPEERERITPQAERFLADALGEVELDVDDGLEPSLRTGFERLTLVPRGGSGRLTCDFGIRLERFGGGARRLRDELLVLETKSEDGESPADRALAEMGVERVSLSKYRVGIAMLAGHRQDPAERLFAWADVPRP